MRGNPKYTYGDVVKFRLEGGVKQGVIAIVDRRGTFEDDSDASYDILVKEENTLYKHFGEKYVIEKVGEIPEEEVWENVYGKRD